jgi:hypothetical protein
MSRNVLVFFIQNHFYVPLLFRFPMAIPARKRLRFACMPKTNAQRQQMRSSRLREAISALPDPGMQHAAFDLSIAEYQRLKGTYERRKA